MQKQSDLKNISVGKPNPRYYQHTNSKTPISSTNLPPTRKKRYDMEKGKPGILVKPQTLILTLALFI